jgi:hypothetical protein
MKKLWPCLLVFFLMPTIFLACKKDRNDEPRNVEEKWLFNKVVYEEYDATDSVVNTETDSVWTANDYLALASNGNFDLVQGGQRLNGIYSIENSVMSLTYTQITNSNTSVSVTTKAPVVEKTSSKFTFYVEEVSTMGKFRATFYMSK